MPDDTTQPASAHGAPPEATPAAAVVALRQQPRGMEVLLLRRHPNMRIYGGAWSFPGGKIDPQDFNGGGREDWIAAARRAAARELHEEAGLELSGSALTLLSRWVTPPQAQQRFTTWFFVAEPGGGLVRINPSESTDHRWCAVAEALAAHAAGAIELPPPTYVTLSRLAAFDQVADLLTAIVRHGP